jgi:hypothetical protein
METESMIISIECEVEGSVRIREIIRTIVGSKEYILKPDGAGWLKTITITKSANRPEEYSRKLEMNPRTNEKIIRIQRDVAEYDELLWDFQELESLLSYETHGGLKKIAWDTRNEEWIPETDEEEERVPISGLKQSKPQDFEKSLNAERFVQLVNTKKKYESLVVLKAFFREGLNEFYSARYINAFYNFYFILEDVYCRGKYKSATVKKILNNSREFKEIMKSMISKNMGEKKYYENIRKLCVETNKEYDIEGLTSLILEIRGRLHHYSSKCSRCVSTPFAHEEFEGIAFLAASLAYHTIENRIKDIDNNSMLH